MYVINAHYKGKKSRKGLWNTNSQTRSLEPNYFNIESLDVKNEIFALQKEEKGSYTVYNNKTKQQIGDKSYESIYSSGWVKNKTENKSYYIDLLTGKEYKD